MPRDLRGVGLGRFHTCACLHTRQGRFKGVLQKLCFCCNTFVLPKIVLLYYNTFVLLQHCAAYCAYLQHNAAHRGATLLSAALRPQCCDPLQAAPVIGPPTIAPAVVPMATRPDV